MLRFSDVMTKFWKRMKILAKKWKKRESENRKFTMLTPMKHGPIVVEAKSA